MELDTTTAVLILTWAVLFLLLLAFAGLLRQVRMIEAKVLGLSGGVTSARVPSDLLPEQVFADGHARAALLFVDPSCNSCYPVMAGAADLAERHPDTRIVIIPLSGSVGFDSDAVVVMHDGGGVLASALAVPAAPFGVLLNSGGFELRRAPVGSSEQLELLLSGSARTTEGVVDDGIYA